MSAQHTPKLKCPRCQGRNLMLTESILIIETRQISGNLITSVLDSEPVTSKGFDALCNHCKHEWRPRAAMVHDAIFLARPEDRAAIATTKQEPCS